MSANADDWSWKINKLFWEKSSDVPNEALISLVCKCRLLGLTNAQRPNQQIHISTVRKYTQILGHSCKIGNMRLLGTPGIQNRQFHAICYFCLLFTLKQYIESRKYDGQPYCTFNQTSVPH